MYVDTICNNHTWLSNKFLFENIKNIKKAKDRNAFNLERNYSISYGKGGPFVSQKLFNVNFIIDTINYIRF